MLQVHARPLGEAGVRAEGSSGWPEQADSAEACAARCEHLEACTAYHYYGPYANGSRAGAAPFGEQKPVWVKMTNAPGEATRREDGRTIFYAWKDFGTCDPTKAGNNLGW